MHAAAIYGIRSSMTQLLLHTIAHFTGPSFMLKAKSQPFQSQFSMLKIIRIVPIFFSLKNINLRAQFLLLTFLTTSIFKPLYFLK